MIDIVLQGEITEYAEQVAEHYLGLPWVHRVILSGWFDGREYSGDSPIVHTIRSVKPPPGVGNRNLQIKSSREGLRLVTTDTAIKMRNDQKVSLASMNLMKDYYEAYKSDGVIFVPGIFPTFPFHPRDHIFWGATEDLRKLFDIPYDVTSLSDDYNKYIRSEAYICMWYYAARDSVVRAMIERPDMYLTDAAPLRHKAIEATQRLALFRPFPRIEFEWPKYGMTEYHYDYTRTVYGEYQADSV